ncbi:hypothetical protein TVAG_100280 [Trichomonas vaginalis G3]|uniref:HEAT repeat domain-containing protein n=1 Tax=Trichomonas vaginalis (strain ATCC PRA-98 / G3) TaxID=412133 RepID=A2G7Q8_TRIV3|nr:armadillo (ARM) repeat-containing protein family [Trichomonas vaginalis G3]EAX86806.1 hypothetical protein TVAG_100280 [Trichomonas vaginalis G3]KAI5516593.1 armadillo (ARM) repeat-containing protein family [Trichomonas vaginalis G3]|eukprot:XP_001299736.1 hypothetical protein [Trichomonas vaginalis G3]
MNDNLGYTSIPYENSVAKQAYFENLPLIAECLPTEDFFKELEIILLSIVRNDKLITKFVEIIPLILQPDNISFNLRFIYKVGSIILTSFNNSLKTNYVEYAEKTLNSYNNVKLEIEEQIKPNLGQFANSKFAIWRLCSLTKIEPQIQDIGQLLYNEFNSPDRIQYAAEFLPFMSPSEAQRHIVNALINPQYVVRVSAVDAISYFKFDLSDQFYETNLCQEKNIKVLEHVLQIPPENISLNILKPLINHPDLSSKAIAVALKSPHLVTLVPDLIKNGCAGAELADINIEVIKNMNPVPYDLIAMLLKESTKLVSDEIIKGIASLDELNVLFHIVFPRMGEKGSWRPRYIAVQIFKELVRNKIADEMIPDYAGFAIAMALDRCYYVRKLVMETIAIFPEGWAKSYTIESILSLANDKCDHFHCEMFKLLLQEAPNVLHGFENLVENAKKAIENDLKEN